MEFKRYKISAPGKIVISGEHAVVYGKLALAASIDLRTTVELTRNSTSFLSIDLCDLQAKVKIDISSPDFPSFPEQEVVRVSDIDENLLDPLREYLNAKKLHRGDQRLYSSLLSILYLYVSIVSKRLGAEIRVSSQIPLSSGLGSSASFSVSVAAAFCVLASEDSSLPDADRVSRWAFLSEKLFHATPSGIDNAVCANGGLIEYQKGKFQPKPSPVSRILLVNTKIPRQTKVLVESVRQRKANFPEILENVLDSIEKISTELTEVLRKDNIDFDRLQELLFMNHWLLATMGVSHEALDSICSIAKQRGHAAKLTGAGGGGLAFVWLRNDSKREEINELIEKYKQLSFECWETRLGVPGLEIDSLNA